VDEQSLKPVYIRLQITASQVDIDRVKNSLSEKLNLSVKGLMVNCSETQLNDSAIQMLCAMTGVARKDGKRLTLFSLSPQASEAIQKNESKNTLDLFGEKQPTATKKPVPKTKTNKWLKLVLGTSFFALPLIALADYGFHAMLRSTPTLATKTFEGVEADPFVVYGTVDSIQSGKRRPDVGAIVIAWVHHAKPELASTPVKMNAHIAYADTEGRFRLPIEATSDSAHLSVRITVLSEALDSSSATKSSSDPATIRPNAYHPTRQTQTYDYVIESGKPVRVNLLFF
jgi:anti-anti-sigma regulatory factor